MGKLTNIAISALFGAAVQATDAGAAMASGGNPYLSQPMTTTNETENDYALVVKGRDGKARVLDVEPDTVSLVESFTADKKQFFYDPSEVKAMGGKPEDGSLHVRGDAFRQAYEAYGAKALFDAQAVKNLVTGKASDMAKPSPEDLEKIIQDTKIGSRNPGEAQTAMTEAAADYQKFKNGLTNAERQSFQEPLDRVESMFYRLEGAGRDIKIVDDLAAPAAAPKPGKGPGL